MKWKTLYKVSFGLGILYLASEILLIPGMVMLYHAQGVSFTDWANYISTNSFYANIDYFGGFVNRILIGLLIMVICFSLYRNKISPNKFLNGATAILSIFALVVFVLIVMNISLFLSSHQIQDLLNISGQISKLTYPIFPIFFFVGLVSLVVGYVKEKIKISSNPRKDLAVILPSLSLAVIVLIDLIRFIR